MTPSRDQQIRALYRAALDRPQAERSAFVAELAGGDSELSRSVELLLTQHGATRPAGEPADHTAAPASFPAGTEIAHYRIDGVLGQGGMGIVYRATDTKLQRPVAIKLLATGATDAQATRRFRQEAAATSSLNHPHIVTVHDVGEHDGRQYIVSELLDGGSLEDAFAATRRRSWRQTLDLLVGIADGVAAAHAAGVLHRDIKPGNILIGTNGYAKLADFGLAKLLHGQREPRDHASRRSHDTQAGSVIGTVAYMSPEQASGQPLDERSDVFSFGIVLYEALAGRRPFEAANDLELLKQILYAAPAALPDDVLDLLRMAVDRALEKEPSDRYQTMRDFVADLRRVARRSASSGTKSGISDAKIAAAIVKRNRRVVGGGAAVLVAAIAGTTYLLASRLAPSSGATASSAGAPGNYTITQLTTSGIARAPAISPDGRYVVYAEGEAGETGSLWLRQVGTSSSVQIVPPESGASIGAPTITRDGLFVHYVRWSDRFGRSALWRVPLLGGTSTHVLNDIASPIGWSPDGRQMAFIRSELSGATSLVVADADGSRERVLATRRPPQFLLSLRIVGDIPTRPVWSPDGNVIAAYEIRAGGRAARLLYVDITSGSETFQDERSVAEGWAGWSASGVAWLSSNALVVNEARRQGQRAQLLRMSYPDGGIAPITNDLVSYVGLDVDEDRDTLVTSRRDVRAVLWVGDASGTAGSEITPSYPHVGIGARVAWAGDRLLYNTLASGVPAIAAVARQGGPPAEIAQDAVIFTATEDAGTIVYWGTTPGLWKSDGSGRQPVALVAGEFAANPLLTPDGRHVIFVAIRTGAQTPWVVPIEGGEARELAPILVGVGDQAIDMTRDGKRVLLATRTEAGAPLFVVCDWPDCSNRRNVVPPPDTRSPVRFTPDGREIAFVDRRGANIWAMPAEGGTPRQVTQFSEPATRRSIAHFAWSADGQRLAVVFMTTTEDVVLISGLQRRQSEP